TRLCNAKDARIGLGPSGGRLNGRAVPLGIRTPNSPIHQRTTRNVSASRCAAHRVYLPCSRSSRKAGESGGAISVSSILSTLFRGMSVVCRTLRMSCEAPNTLRLGQLHLVGRRPRNLEPLSLARDRHAGVMNVDKPPRPVEFAVHLSLPTMRSYRAAVRSQLGGKV